MASLKFRHYSTESALKGNGTVQNALNAFDVGTIVFIDDTQKQYIITSKSNNVVTYKIYYGKAAVVGVSGTDAARILTFSDGSEIKVTINNVEHATSSDTAETAKSVDWNNVIGKPTNFVTTDDTQTITGSKTFTNNVSLQGSTSADSITAEDLIVNGAARFVSGLTGDLKGNVVGNVTGNVAGNVSGTLTGDATGNAGSATKLQTARNINGTSFNGTASITTAKWGTARNITIADNTNEHTQANNSIDGSADFTLKLPTTIKADIIGNASTADSAKSVDWANVINTPNFVTTDTEQTITGAKIFNNNTTFKNETDVESLTADSLLVTGSARFTNTINGNLKGNVEGNLTGNASTATTAATATEFSANKTVALTGDVTGSASSKGGWSVATTIANGAVTNAKLANSKITIAGTAVSLGGSIAASTIGNALTTSAPAAYATNAGSATKAAEAEKAIKDSDGNAINTTYLKKSGGTVSGALTLNGATTVNSTLTADSVTASNLTVNGAAKFNNSLEGNLKGNVDGNATTATTCTGNAATATTATNLANKPSGSFTAATVSADASLTITTGGKTSDTITIGKVKSAFTADSAITATSCSGNAATATLANEAKNLQNTTPETKDESFFSKVVAEDADMVSFQTLKGNSVVWNQKFPYDVSKWRGDAGSMTIDGSVITLSCGSSSYVEKMTLDQCIIAGHKYYTRVTIVETVGFFRISESDTVSFIRSEAAGTYSSIKEASSNTTLKIVNAGGVGQGATFKDVLFVDLTQMFGAGNEPSTYEEFLQRKPKVADEYAYNEGTIVNNKVEKVKTTGVNLWDESKRVNGKYIDYRTGEEVIDARYSHTGYVRVLPNTEYYFKQGAQNPQYGAYYDADKNFISGLANFKGVFTTPAQAAYVRITLGAADSSDNICINFSDPTINGKYFPYEEHTLDLAWVKDIKDSEGIKLFEDGIKSAGTAFDEVRKNKAVKRLGVKVFDGTEEWVFSERNGHKSLGTNISSDSAKRDDGGIIPTVSNLYKAVNAESYWNSTENKTFHWSGGFYTNQEIMRLVDDDFSDIVSWKQHLSDLYAQGNPLTVIYELAEPIEVELPYGINHTLPVWKDGMMYAESSQSSTPIVCTNVYYTNIRESVKKFIGDADSIYASTSGYNAHGTWNIDISGKASSAITANSAITATSATTATTCTGNAGTATTLQNTRKINGTDFNGSADITTSKWGTARNITISDGTNSGTATSVDGSGAITLNLPGTIKANLSGNASTATKATNSDRATGDSDGNAINTTYLKRSGGTVTGNVTFNSSVTADSITAEDLIVNGASRFVSGITGDLVGNVTGNVTGNLSGNASSATNATNDGSGNTITSTYATKTERANNDITAASLTASKLTLTRAAGNIEANVPTWNQDTTGTAAKATADAKGNNIINTYATKAEVAALPKSMVIKGTLDATHALPTSGMTEGDTYIVGASGTYNGIACKVGDFFVRTSDGWLRVPAGDEWEYDENTIKAIKVNNAVHSDTAGTASAVAWAGITGIPDLVTTDAEQTITGNKSFKNNTSIESLTADSLLVTGPARFTNNIQGNLIGNVTGYLTGNISGSSTSCSGNADNATKDGNGNNIVNTYARIDKVYDDSGAYRQFLGKSGSSSDWVRTTESGIIPYISGDASHGHSSLGTSSWYFSEAYIQNIYGYLNGNISGSSTSCSGNSGTASKLTDLSSTDLAASSATWRKVWFSYDDGTTGRPSLSDNFAYQTSTNTLKVPNLTLSGNATINGTTTMDSLTAGNLTVNGGATFNNGLTGTLTGSLIGNADTASSCSGNSATATKAGYLDTGTMTLYAHNNNEINFGGTSTSSEIYFGYRATESRPIPTSFIFGGSGTATLTAGGFKKSGSSSSYVLTGDGGHAAISGLSVNYATTSGACTGNSATATKATQDSDGNAINTTYLKLSGGTVTGNVTFNSSIASDSLTTEDLIVNGAARFVSGLTGDLIGNVTGNLTGTASYATNAESATIAGSATTASACTGNSATATKLETARTIWGQSFDGSSDITGPIHVKYKSSEWNHWNEGIRLYGSAASNAWSNIHFGCDPDATSGTHTNQWMIGRNTGNNFGIWHGTDSTNAVFFINTSDNVGIGTASPTSKLHVAGTGYFASDVSSASNIIAGGYIKGEMVKISSGCTLEYSSTDKCIRFVFN